MKTREELNLLKDEVTALNRKLAELNEDELRQVTGGAARPMWDEASAGLICDDAMQGKVDPIAGVYARIVRTDGAEPAVGPWYPLSELEKHLPVGTGAYKIEYIMKTD